jgi:hypothetical protein
MLRSVTANVVCIWLWPNTRILKSDDSWAISISLGAESTWPGFIQIIWDRKKIYDSPHMEIFGLILHNTEELNERFLKLLVACAMEPKCMAPPTAKWTCDFDFSGKLYADCHRYDESAMNIILKNWFNFDNSIILRNPTTFKVYDFQTFQRMLVCVLNERIYILVSISLLIFC